MYCCASVRISSTRARCFSVRMGFVGEARRRNSASVSSCCATRPRCIAYSGLTSASAMCWKLGEEYRRSSPKEMSFGKSDPSAMNIGGGLNLLSISAYVLYLLLEDGCWCCPLTAHGGAGGGNCSCGDNSVGTNTRVLSSHHLLRRFRFFFFRNISENILKYRNLLLQICSTVVGTTEASIGIPSS